MDQPRLNLYFREIIYHHPSAKKDSVCGVFSYEALNVEEAKLGNLYLVGKISNLPPKKHRSFDFLLTLLASAIKREFYSDSKRTTIEALESALQSANIYLTDFTKRGHREWIGNLDFTCLAFSENNIHIGQTGNILIYILRGGTISNISKKFVPPSQNNQTTKTFSNIASGILEEDDKLMISTTDILEIASVQKIKELLSPASTEEIYEFIKKHLENQNKNKDAQIKYLACLFLEAKSKTPIKEKKPEKQEEKLEIIALDLEKILNPHSARLNKALKSKISPTSKLSKPINSFLNFHTHNYLLALFLILFFLLSPYLAQKIYYEIKISQVNNLIKRTNGILLKTNLALAYQEQNKAQSLLRKADNFILTASSILEKLPERVKENPSFRVETIQKKLENQQNSINNVINIDEPEEIADLSKNSFTFAPQGILKLGNFLYSYELNSGFLYKINLDDINNHVLVFLSSKETFKLGTVEDDSLVLLSSPEKIYIYSKNDNYNTHLLRPSLENTLDIKDMAGYENSLFFLNTEKLSILKYNLQESTYNGEDWLKENFKQDLTNAQSIAVDGSVYILKSDGVIFEYAQGKRVREIKLKINPILNGEGQLFTTDQTKKIYILDPANKRIVIQNKNDDLNIQYMSEKFDSLKDFWVDSGEETIYVLNGSKVYKINL